MIENYQRAKANIGDLLDGYMLGDAVSHIEIYEKGICDTPIAATSSIHDFIGKCDNLWAYYTGGQSDLLKSNCILTVSRERNRMLGVQLYYYGIKGFLHWAFNNYYGIQSCYRFNPALNPTGGFALAGTSYMVYPDFDGGCFQSVRQKIFAEGLLDIRLLSLLARLKGKEVCEAVIEKHFGEIHFDKSAESPEAYIAFINDVYSAIAN